MRDPQPPVSALERSFDRLGRALLAAALSFGAPAVARGAALIGPYSLEIGILLMAVAFGMLLVAVGLLISCAFVGVQAPTPESSSRYWRGETSSSQPEPDHASVEPEPCHCMNCLNEMGRRGLR